MEMFSFIKDCLLTFNYPLAHSMSDEELGEIFKASNRCFLISWMLKLLDNAYEEALENSNSENDKDFLGNFVYELGFCTQKEKLPFMSGGLPVNQQVKILFNMFTFITDIKKNVVENKAVVTNNEITALINTNLNLFPMYGDIKLQITDEHLKLEEFEKEINEIKDAVLKENRDHPEHLLKHEFSNEIHVLLEKLKDELPNIKFVMEGICKKKDRKSREVINLQANSSEILKKCRDNLQTISQFVKDINTIEDFVTNDLDLNEEEERNEAHYEMVNVLYQEVSNAMKYLRCL